jgi:hypothetical protein
MERQPKDSRLPFAGNRFKRQVSCPVVPLPEVRDGVAYVMLSAVA